MLSIAGGILLGLLVGSFLNVVIYRLPVMLEREWRQQCQELLAHDNQATSGEAPQEVFNLLQPRSRCPRCSAPVRAWQNVPVLSWLLLGGKCSTCKGSISVRYPLIELLTGLLSGLLVWRFGVTIEAAGALLLLWSLIALTVIDLDTQLLPDCITLPLLWLGICVSLLQPATSALHFPDLRSSVIGAIVGYTSLWLVYWVFKLLTGKEGMGYGDFKLLAALGAWLGWQMLPLVILLSALTGALAGVAMIILLGRDRQLPIPFGPYLAVAGLIALLWGTQITNAYLSISGL
jgi:leader peptidase (prepilin peptidase) / N-methyltransferase